MPKPGPVLFVAVLALEVGPTAGPMPQTGHPTAAPAEYRLHLQTIDRADLPVPVLNLAMLDVRRIWAPYRIAVAWSSKAPDDDARDILVRVVFQQTPRTADEPARLAWIPFLDGDVPRDVVYAAPGRALQVMNQRRRLIEKPRLLQEAIVGQAIGRSVAHEIGHFLTASAAHAETGLMRAVFSQAELAAPGLSAFTLTIEEVQRIRERLRSSVEAGRR